MIQTSARAIPGARRVIAQHGLDGEARPLAAGAVICAHGQGPERQLEPMLGRARRRAARCTADRRSCSRRRTVLANRFDQRERDAPPAARPRSCTRCGTPATSARRAPDRCRMCRPARAPAPTEASVGGEVAVAEQRLQDAVRRHHHREARGLRTAARGCRRARSAGAASAGARPRAPRAVEHRLPSDRCRRCATPARASGNDTRPVPQPSSRTGPSARAATPARTARRAGRACARSPSRRTARTRPSPRTVSGGVSGIGVGD